MHSLSRKPFVTIGVLSMLVTAGVAAVNIPREDFKNLKILPKDISLQKLDSIMESYNKALAVNCSFCHTQVKNFPDSLDFASDENHMKEEARRMMRMTIDLNKTWFYFNKDQQPIDLNVVQCMTCHRGDPYPVMTK
jgi:hypothetical protein